MTQLISPPKYHSWQGFAFEQLFYQHRERIAEKLGFGAVMFHASAWYAKRTRGENAQIDLLFIRADGVHTICEMKFQEKKIGKECINEMNRKIDIYPIPKNKTLERVLITSSEPTGSLK